MDMSSHKHHQKVSPSSINVFHSNHLKDLKFKIIISVLLTIPIIVLSPFFQNILGIEKLMQFQGNLFILWALSSLVYFYCGLPFLKGFIVEMKNRQPGMMTLVAVAISTAYIYSSAVVFGVNGEIFFWELATLIDIMLLGHWVEMKAVHGASMAIESLSKLLPSIGHRVKNNKIEDIPIDSIKNGDRLLVKPGENVPADGFIFEGVSTFNESLLSGESLPSYKTKGAMVIGGSINGEGSVIIEVNKTGSESFLAQVIKLTNDARMSRSKTQDIADKAALILTVIAIGSGILTLTTWLLLSRNFEFALQRTVTVLIIACPHALGLAIPLVVAISTSLSASHGLLIKNRYAFEKSKNIKAVLFDKTGTLTLGRFGVSDVISFDQRFDKNKLFTYAASVETHSEHPIARGIVESSPDTLPVKNFKAITGEGAQGFVDGHNVKIVSPGYLKKNNIRTDYKEIVPLMEKGKTVVYILIDDEIQGAFALSDIIRPESSIAIIKLKKMGIQTFLITGDNRKSAARVAKEIGIDEYFAEIPPGQKGFIVKQVQSRGLTTAMAGDGINDAPALAQADIGIAIGSGTDVAAETADIILVKNNPEDVVSLIKLSKKTYRKMTQNLWWAAGYNIIAIPLAAGILYNQGIILSPAAGAFLMTLSTMIVAINARLLKY